MPFHMCMTYELIKPLCVVYIIIRMCLFSFNKTADSSSRDRLSALRLHAPKLPILVRRGRGIWILIRSCYSRLVTVQLDGSVWNINQTTLTFRRFPPMLCNVKKIIYVLILSIAICICIYGVVGCLAKAVYEILIKYILLSIVLVFILIL